MINELTKGHIFSRIPYGVRTATMGLKTPLQQETLLHFSAHKQLLKGTLHGALRPTIINAV